MADTKGTESTNAASNELEKRVDAMMDIRPSADKTPPPPLAQPAQPPQIDIFSDPKTAPEVSANLLKEIGATPAEPAPVTQEAAPAAPTETPAAQEDIPPAYEDPATAKAVDDIVAKESDTVLAAEDAAARPPEPPKPKSFGDKFRGFFRSKWLWLLLLVALAAVFAVPYTRYKLLGLVIRQSYAVQVADDKTTAPVSNAVVEIAGKTAKTDANGKAVVRAPIGSQQVTVKKQYFKTYSGTVFVGFKVSPGTHKITLTATGRQVPITVVNTITRTPLSGVEVKVLDTTAKTDASGQATIVLPTAKSAYQATLELSGYNTAKANVTVTGQKVPANTLVMTPAGQLYFLSNLTGTIDVVKTNLDGTGRKTVLAGTGKEDANTTALLATQDWRYLALMARRGGSRPALYLIDTSTDKLTQFDSSDASFSIIGWSGHNFLYSLTSNTVPQSQSGHQLVKSYDAETRQLNQLDQTQAEGTPDSYGYQNFYNFAIADGSLVYSTQWYTYDTTSATYDLKDKTASIRAVQPGRQNKKDLQTFAASSVSYFQSGHPKPQTVHVAVYGNDGKTTYYSVEDDNASTLVNPDLSEFATTLPTYLVSPSAKQVFWTEQRDGKNALFVGDANAGSKKQIASLSDYAPYGWFGDDYLLVSKNGSELSIMPVSGPTTTRPPFKVSDYYKPAHVYAGYGEGYGGI